MQQEVAREVLRFQDSLVVLFKKAIIIKFVSIKPFCFYLQISGTIEADIMNELTSVNFIRKNCITAEERTVRNLLRNISAQRRDTFFKIQLAETIPEFASQVFVIKLCYICKAQLFLMPSLELVLKAFDGLQLSRRRKME